jgi:hypothetical protein
MCSGHESRLGLISTNLACFGVVVEHHVGCKPILREQLSNEKEDTAPGTNLTDTGVNLVKNLIHIEKIATDKMKTTRIRNADRYDGPSA